MAGKHGIPFAMLALLLGLALVVGCSDDDDDPVGPGGGGGGGVEDVGSISGQVRGTGGDLSDVTVSAAGQTATTSEDGFFILTNVDEGTHMVSFVRDGYVPSYRVAEVLEGQTTFFGDATAVVLVREETGTVAAAAGGTVATGDGDGEVEFGADAFVTPAGDPFTGDVTVELAALLPDDDEFYGAFPGEFEGVRSGGGTVPFVSYGFMSVQLSGPDKAPLELADGETATLRLTLPPEKAMSAPATIPMWYFDEDAGVWREEGQATLDGNVYTADVAHFTTWNWDLPLEDICEIRGSVVDEDGAAVAGARVLSRGVDMAIMDEAYTDAQGRFSLRAARNGATDVWAMSGSLISSVVRVDVQETCPVELTTALVLDIADFVITLTWGESPRDLDSHLLIPMVWDDDYELFHLYYSNRDEASNLADYPYAQLDDDDTSSYGPEIFTGSRLLDGRYQYWVHNYSEDENASLQSSEALVNLEAGGRSWVFEAANLTMSDTTPDEGWWHVFDLVVAGGLASVEPVMEFQAGFSYDGLGTGTSKLLGK